MAVISDLPEDVLHRIIDLVNVHAIDYNNSHLGILKNWRELVWNDKANLALVARKWTAPAQKLLYEEVMLDTTKNLNRFVQLINLRRKRTSTPFPVGKLSLEVSNPFAVERLFKLNELQIHGLSTDEPVQISIDNLISSGVRYLHLNTPDLVIPGGLDDDSGTIRGISIDDNDVLPPLETMREFLDWAGPTLTRLDLDIIPDDDYGSDVLEFFYDVAPQLTHLSLNLHDDKIFSSRLPSPLTPLTIRALSSLSSLKSLTLHLDHPNQLTDILPLLPCRLKLLSLHSYSPNSSPVGHPSFSKACLKGLQSPCLRELKRWRMNSLLKLDRTKGEGLKWLVKCEKMGIEVRDEKRYFTD